MKQLHDANGKWFVRLTMFATVWLWTASVVQASTTVSADISSNTHWTVAGSPYLVTIVLDVQSGATLTIDAGVVVRFDAGRSLRINTGAQLISNGTGGNPVVFTSYRDADYGGAGGASMSDWGGIHIGYFDNTLEYCLIRYAGSGGA
ncbi:MAG: hypothetical protein JXB04_09675, partial [Kiritimatiellae bacterium]|nr:hypothetical protein [Kiritimatiellia bacterium]